ncbi:MAG TPA: twin-arginine translocase TatA/TatE family subunit [Bdellovibrio sp.]|uniref:Sec-independent protein translocase subunit TatA/TatB n=1 Tax=Bdellovibrio sp. TaxID=28201 RepID=UPI002EFEBAA6
MFGLSIFEILFLAGLALIVIGPKELPEVARTIGRFLNELKRSTSGLTNELKQQARIDRIDLYEAPKKPTSHAGAAVEPTTTLSTESARSDVAPEQMELPVQNSVADSSANETKKS